MFSDFLEELKQKEIEISFSEGKIQYSGPEKNVTPELILKLNEFRENLILHFWPPECKDLVLFNSKGNKTPIIMVLGMNFNYLLSKYFGQDQPLYGFFDDVSIGQKNKLNSVESIAENYLNQLKKILPSGPYILGGYCFGGVVAYEMAIQLEKSGQKVLFLAITESYSPYFLKSINLKFNAGFFKSFFWCLVKLLFNLIKLSLYNGLFLFVKILPEPLKDDYVNKHYSNLNRKYKPEKYTGHLLLFRVQSGYSIFKHNLGWGELVSNVDTIYLKGNHLSVTQIYENAEIVGNELKRMMQSNENSVQ